MNKLVKLVTLTVFGAGLALSGAACGLGEPRYEDCEVSDQDARESDCGYYSRGGQYRLSNTALPGWEWNWWSWVVVGQNSFPPEGWKPPHGLKPPTESSESKKRRKQHEKKAPANNKPTGAKNTNKKPVTGTGNQGVPKNNPAPKPPAPRPAGRR